jgi:hypothetical protein
MKFRPRKHMTLSRRIHIEICFGILELGKLYTCIQWKEKGKLLCVDWQPRNLKKEKLKDVKGLKIMYDHLTAESQKENWKNDSTSRLYMKISNNKNERAAGGI